MRDSGSRFQPAQFVRRWIRRAVFAVLGFLAFGVIVYSVISPPTTPYILSEARRLGGIDRAWIAIENVSPHMARSVVAAEDANFCNHWGFDMTAIRAALDSGSTRGASTISQQVVKNVYLWHGRSWVRKVLEAGLTPAVEAVWTKKRIVEVYLNIAEFDEGVFGVDAAAHHYFGKTPSELTATQASLLAAVLPNPKGRSASKPTTWLSKHARSIADGAATIKADGRSACFEG
ncbi:MULTISPECIES: monofunctional biosynthetic peptidoglycan transglycosylase [Falsihalocynthiibacter]|uniref:monofunctional biosynthetic peptidoglycan transglycosylase n=1 Tax=Falsihalocynthiibacter TaxID=2854182 RepID=UPI0030034E7B